MPFLTERFDVEWNAGNGWRTDSRHQFWTEASARKCYGERLLIERLAKCPMRLKHVDLVTGAVRILPLS